MESDEKTGVPADKSARDPLTAWPSLWRYAPAPVAIVALLYVWHTPGSEIVRHAVYGAALLLIVLAWAWQVRAARETTRLRADLDAARQSSRALEQRNSAMAEHVAFVEQLSQEHHLMSGELEHSNRALAEANTRLQALTTTDPLTDLPNHRALIAVVDQEIERAVRYRRPCAVLLFDIDHFKAINDGRGHAAGDAALREFAMAAKAALRGVDTLGRWGGEEFLAILPETDLEAALVAAERVRAAVAAHAFSPNGARLTCSIGAAACPQAAEERDGLIEAAAHAMYAAKRLGRNQVRAAADPAVAVLAAESEKGESREDAALVGAVEALAALVEARDQYTGAHMQAVSILALRLALALGLDASDARMIGLAGQLHDVGKIAVPEAILRKPGRLAAEEWALVRRHPVVGADVVGRVPALRVLAPVIRAHHERWDGRGYPDNLAGESIPLGARIVAAADAYGAMTTQRPYKDARSPDDALAEMNRCAGTQFDPAVVAALERVLAGDPMLARRLGVA